MDAVNAGVCTERHRSLSQQIANIIERQDSMEVILTGNGDPKKGIINQTLENTEFRKQMQDFIWSVNKRIWGTIAASLVGGLGTMAVLAYYLSKMVK